MVIINPIYDAAFKFLMEDLDLITDEPVNAPSKFVESLSHDTYVIQAKELHHDVKSKLERILSVFGQEEFIDEKVYKIDFPDSAESTKKNELLQKILRRLHKAATENTNLVEQMDAQDQLDQEIESGYLELKQEKEKLLHEKEEAQREKEEERRLKEEAQREKEEAQRREKDAQLREEEERREKEELRMELDALKARLMEAD